jgi:hypothetical protein
MEIEIRKLVRCKAVSITHNSTTIDLGLHDDEECRALAKQLKLACERLLENIEDEPEEENKP